MRVGRLAHELERSAGAEPADDVLTSLERYADDLEIKLAGRADRREAISNEILGAMFEQCIDERSRIRFRRTRVRLFGLRRGARRGVELREQRFERRFGRRGRRKLARLGRRRGFTRAGQ